MDNVHAETLAGALLAVAAAIDRLADGLAGPDTRVGMDGVPAQPAYRLAEIREQYPNAYDRWSPEDDTTLREAYQRGQDVESLADAFGRNKGAIRARLMRLGFPLD
ncbi:MAG TPA: hypothetical protein VHW06_17980 [Streptosporangiaceae bacterium]|jgi:hypothetical protein|nr:hypothetical protein [Streptosporangiaceae bacterium]